MGILPSVTTWLLSMLHLGGGGGGGHVAFSYHVIVIYVASGGGHVAFSYHVIVIYVASGACCVQLPRDRYLCCIWGMLRSVTTWSLSMLHLGHVAFSYHVIVIYVASGARCVQLPRDRYLCCIWGMLRSVTMWLLSMLPSGACCVQLPRDLSMLHTLIEKCVISNIYQETKDNADNIWKFERYDMIMEFKDKPILPPPLSIFENIYILIKLAIQHCIRSYEIAHAALKYERQVIKNNLF